ncbi:MAG: phenylalanine--tRNA ligase subunit beta, partial [Eggerthellaceae bacterium]|nr:phenylalanine--tRNA ligase subunit beta [Eggerthellaceae bacterium]
PESSERIGIKSEYMHISDLVNESLRASGLNETMTYSFADEHDMENLGMEPDGYPVELINPINTEQSVMRQSIIPGLIRSVAYNQAHGVKNVELYEIGKVFSEGENKKLPKEKTKVAGVLSGAMNDKQWNQETVEFDFFDGKGVLENLSRELAMPKVRYKALTAEEAPYLQPGRAAQMLSGGAVVGWVGEIHPKAVKSFGATPPVVAFELDLSALEKLANDARPYEEVSIYPPVTIDIALVVNEDVTNERMMQVIKSAGGKLLESVDLFDIYRDDDKVGKNKKSMAYKLTYRANDRTLTTEEVDHAHQRLLTKVEKATGAEVRS